MQGSTGAGSPGVETRDSVPGRDRGHTLADPVTPGQWPWLCEALVPRAGVAVEGRIWLAAFPRGVPVTGGSEPVVGPPPAAGEAGGETVLAESCAGGGRSRPRRTRKLAHASPACRRPSTAGRRRMMGPLSFFLLRVRSRAAPGPARMRLPAAPRRARPESKRCAGPRCRLLQRLRREVRGAEGPHGQGECPRPGCRLPWVGGRSAPGAARVRRCADAHVRRVPSPWGDC